jgi:hypothetical protein
MGEKQSEPGRTEAIAAAVALAIERRRRALWPRPLASKPAEMTGPDEWAMSGRIAQVDRAPARDPWNR